MSRENEGGGADFDSYKPWKGKRPWIPGMLKKGGVHLAKKSKRVRVNDKAKFHKEEKENG